MSRIAVCLFFIAILQTGIITFSQANDEETTTKPTDVEPDKGGSPSLSGSTKLEAEDKSVVSSTTPKKELQNQQTFYTDKEGSPSLSGSTKLEAEEKSGVSSTTEPNVEEASDVPLKKDNKKTEAKANETKKENVTEKIGDKLSSNVLKGAPVEHTKVLFEFPKNIFGPVTAAGAKIGEAVSKGIDTAKDFAGGTYDFLRNSATSLFEK